MPLSGFIRPFTLRRLFSVSFFIRLRTVPSDMDSLAAISLLGIRPFSESILTAVLHFSFAACFFISS